MEHTIDIINCLLNMNDLSSNETVSPKKWSVLILAAGYGTRLANDIRAEGSAAYGQLLSLPKALLPIAGVPLLDYWYHDLQRCASVNIENFFIVTNNRFYHQFVDWAMIHGISSSNIINDGTATNDDRLGAVGDIALCLETFQSKLRQSQGVLVIAGDTLFYDDFNLSEFMEKLSEEGCQDNDVPCSGIVYYNIRDEMETLKRGIIEVDETSHRVFKLLEKPHPSDTNSRKACPAFYAYHRNVYDDIMRYYHDSLSLPIDERDAPGKLLSWLIAQQGTSSQARKSVSSMIKAYEISGRFDIGNLIEYQQTLQHFTHKLHHHVIDHHLINAVHEKCYARVGFLGNPSDGFRGKTLSFLVKNFYAEVFIENNASSSYECSKSEMDSYLSIHHHAQVKILPHPEYDPSSFQNLQGLHVHTATKGYYGGVRLLQAVCKVFSALCSKNGIYFHMQRGFTMRYDTNIPRMVGLSGSSAIVVAAFRCLLRYYGLTLADLNIAFEAFPQVVLDIERHELEISAGLQDRVIQVYGGLVFMDFTGSKPSYTSLDPNLLPSLYLAYNTNTGGDSGKVHSTVKERWIRQESELVDGMQAIGSYAQQAHDALMVGDMTTISSLMDQNFAMRRKLYHDEVVGEANIMIAEMLKAHGLACKFTGSGGAFVCMRQDGVATWLDEVEEKKATVELHAHGFELVRIQIP